MKSSRALIRISSIIGILMFPLLLSGCKKMIEVPPPSDRITAPDVFVDNATATSAVDGIYSQAMAGNLLFLNGAISIFPALSADEIYNTSPNPQMDPFTNNAIPVNESTTLKNRLWVWGYKTIYQANACLHGLKASHSLSSTTRRQLTGECEFMRALCYFYLTNLFGDVPLVVTTDYLQNEKMARTPSDSIYGQIITDLLDARSELDVAYPTGNPVRPNKWAATALLARVYLYEKKWKDADTCATAVINSGSYHLVNDLNKVFLANSPEAILQFIPVSPYFNTAEGFSFIPFSPNVKPAYALTPFLVNAFEAGDLRKQDWLDSNVVGGKAYYYPHKYKVRFAAAVTEYNMVLRLSEQYLIGAEARAELNDVSGAQTYLNVVRSRAGLPNTTAATSSDLVDAVLHERQVELFTEWGSRWFDLKRTGKIDAVLGMEKAGWKPKDALYPIPLDEIHNNPFLTQNPGYN